MELEDFYDDPKQEYTVFVEFFLNPYRHREHHEADNDLKSQANLILAVDMIEAPRQQESIF